MKNDKLKQLIGRRLFGLCFQREEQVLRELTQASPPFPARRLRLLPALALILALVLTGTALAISLSLSARFEARQQAVNALGTQYGLNEDSLGLFNVYVEKDGDAWLIRAVPKSSFPGKLGEYEVILPQNGSPQTSWNLEHSPDYQPDKGLASPVWGHGQLMEYINNKNAYYLKASEVDWENAATWSLEDSARIWEQLNEALPYGELAGVINTVPGAEDMQPEEAREMAIKALGARYGLTEGWQRDFTDRMGFQEDQQANSRFYTFSFRQESKDSLGRWQRLDILLSSPDGQVLKAEWFLPDPAHRTLPTGDLANHPEAVEEYMDSGAFDTLNAKDKAALASRLQAAGMALYLQGKLYLMPTAKDLTEEEATELAYQELERRYGLKADSRDLFRPSLSLQSNQQGATWSLELSPVKFHHWPFHHEPPLGTYSVSLDAKTGEPKNSAWSLAGTDPGNYTKTTWGQAEAYAGYILPWFESLYQEILGVLSAAEDVYFLNVQEAARHDQAFRDAGFPAERFLSGLPGPRDLTEAQALKTAYEALRQVYGLQDDVLANFDLVWPGFFLHSGYQRFTSEKPFWIISFHHTQDIWVVALDAASGEVLDVSYDPAAAGNG